VAKDGGSRRIGLQVAIGLLTLVVVGAAVAFFVWRAQPAAAPTDGQQAMGVVVPSYGGPSTYESKQLGFRFRYPGGWGLSESRSASGTEGDYLTLTFVPKTSSGKLIPPKMQIVPDPQGFSAEAIARMKWGSAPTTLTVTTSTLDVPAGDAIEVRLTEPATEIHPLQTYEAIVILRGRLYLLRFATPDRDEFEAFASQVHEVARSLSAY
jgi:hypothetical protein